MLKKLLKILIAGGLAVMVVSGVSADVIPTSIWTSFYGSASSYNGNPLPVGSIIDAYDASLVHCGTYTVDSIGVYGFMQVYGDDGYGEGPDLGEAITFYINGRLAGTHGPDPAVWAGKGIREVNLSATADVSMMLTGLPYDGQGVPGETVRYYATVRNTGQGTDFYTVSAVSEHGWLIEPKADFAYALTGEEATVYFDVLIPYAIYVDMDDEVMYKVISGVDASVFIEHTVTTHVMIPTSTPEEESRLLPGVFKLYQNYPNPFNPTTVIAFNLPTKADAELEVIDILGRTVNKVNLGSLEAGFHSVEYDAASHASGVYLYRIKAGELSAVKKMLLMK